jgi:hypothetical protein
VGSQNSSSPSPPDSQLEVQKTRVDLSIVTTHVLPFIGFRRSVFHFLSTGISFRFWEIAKELAARNGRLANRPWALR